MTAVSRAIALTNRIEDLDVIYAGLASVLAEAGLPDSLRKTLFLICEELFSNVVRYGYKDGEEDRIDLTVVCDADSITLTFHDHAAEFDISVAPDAPSDDRSLDQMDVGGLGLYLVHQFAASVRNWRESDANITEIIVPAAQRAHS